MKKQIIKSDSALCTWSSYSTNKELAIVTARFNDGPTVRKIVLMKRIEKAGIEEGERFLGTEIVYGNPLHIDHGSKRSFVVEKILPTTKEEKEALIARLEGLFEGDWWKEDY